TQQQTIHLLAWLAKQMVQHSQPDFYIERLQPDWLANNRLHRLYGSSIPRLVVGLVFGLIVWLIVGVLLVLVSGLTIGLYYGFASGFSAGLIFALLLETDTEIEPK